MGTVADSATVGSDQVPEKLLSVDERRFAQIPSVQIEAIEGVIDEAVDASLTEVRLQERELGNAALVCDHHLAVDYGGAQRQASERLPNGVAKFFCPIEPAPRPQRDLAVHDMRLEPITVELDLVQPSAFGGRSLAQGRQHRLDEVGQGGFGCGLDRRRVRRFLNGRARFRLGSGALRRLDLSCL
jgi:hypothetical protein